MEQTAGRLAQLIAIFEQETHDPEALQEVLVRSGLTKDCKGDGKDIEPHAEAEFIRHACDVLGDTTFGVSAGLQLTNPGTLNNYIAKFSENLRAAVENSQKYYHAIDPSHTYSLRVSGNSAYFELERADPTFAKYHRFTEFLLFVALNRLRTITGVAFYPIEMRFDHVVKNQAKAIQKLAGFPVVFGAERTEIILPLSTIDLPIPTYEPKLKAHLMHYGDRLLSETDSPTPSLRAHIEQILSTGLPGRVASADEVAAHLGMSHRTFARRLNEDGLSFRGIVDDLRCDLAKTYLKDGFSIAEVAFYLDYSDQAGFSTAFKRWTGQSPKAYRDNFNGPVR